MRITIVNGFFLPVPPLRGGATEKSWHALARVFAARGHEVVSVSRTWPGQAEDETAGGIRHLRLPGADHHRSLWRNLLRDLRWSLRVQRRLPPADIVVCHALALPVWLGTRRPAAGRVVVMCGRVPKGQYRRYRALARVLAPSAVVRDWVLAENPALAGITRVTGYPIDWRLLQSVPRPEPGAPVTIGYVGRLHEEKGLSLLADAVARLAADPALPPWRLVLCGPSATAQGGSGEAWVGALQARLGATLGPGRCDVLPPVFADSDLAALYGRIDVFCYPSQAARGETFGVAVAEAMAAGAAPVVSALPCFADLVRAGETGLVFDHTAPDAADRLAGALRDLLVASARRARIAAAARAAVQRFDFPLFADDLLADFATLTRS